MFVLRCSAPRLLRIQAWLNNVKIADDGQELSIAEVRLQGTLAMSS